MPTRIAVFCMPEPGHFQLLRPLLSGLARLGATVDVFTDRRFEPKVRQAGAEFTDLFTKYPLAPADDASTPFPCRLVSYAGRYASEITAEVKRFRPSLIILETFSLVGRVVADSLGLPWVNLSPGHDLDPAKFLRRLEADPRVSISPSCRRAVATLREQHGLADASPFSFVTSLSPYLNLYCEPPAFLTAAQRRVFEPVAFFGSLPLADTITPLVSYFGDPSRLKIYVSFGNIVWRYYRNEAFAVLRSIASHVASRPDAEAVISLGHADLEPAQRRELTSGNVRVETYVDQPAVLSEADVFVTHHGINSTHEGIFSGVPMLSYPFFWDQPDLATTCQARGLAVPLGGTLRGPVSEAEVALALGRLSREAGSMRARLGRAREDELEVMARRGAVYHRIMALANGS